MRDELDPNRQNSKGSFNAARLTGSAQYRYDSAGTRIAGPALYTDLEALALLTEYASTFNTTSQQLCDDVSSAIVGSTGTFTIVQGFRYPGRRLPGFLDSGFHPDFQDGEGQLFHFWAPLNSIVQDPTIGIYLVFYGDIVHEDVGFPDQIFEGKGATIQDKALTFEARRIALAIHNGEIPPTLIGETLRRILGTESVFPWDNYIPDECWLGQALNEAPHVYFAGCTASVWERIWEW